MKYLAPGLVTEIGGNKFFLATCVKIIQRDNITKYFTDWDQDLTVSGDVYRCGPGIKWYSLESGAGFDTSSFVIEGLISNASSSANEVALQVGFLSNASIEIFQVNPNNIAGHGKWPLKYGRISRVFPKDLFFSLECESLDSKLTRNPIVKTYTIDCRWDFGDANCGFSVVSHTGEVTSIADDFTFTDSAFGGPATAGYFSYGKIVFDDLPTVPNRIKSYNSVTKTFVMMLPLRSFYGVPSVGSAFTVYQGCSKKYTYCRDTLFWVEKFGGFPFIPDPNKPKLNIPMIAGAFNV